MAEKDFRHELEERPQSRREWSGWGRSIVLPVAILVLIVGGLLYYEDRRAASIADDGFGTVALPPDLNPTGRAPAASLGHAAPDFVLETLDGGSMRLSDLRGQPVLVNFWASWCEPCRAEMPMLVEMHERYAPDGLVLLAIDVRESRDRVRRTAEDFGLSYPIVLDRRGQVAETWRIEGPNRGLPSTYFIDGEGVIRKVVFGLLSKSALDEGLALIIPAAD